MMKWTLNFRGTVIIAFIVVLLSVSVLVGFNIKSETTKTDEIDSSENQSSQGYTPTTDTSSDESKVKLPLDDVIIVIDPGHGYPDGGTVGATTKVHESKLNLEIATIIEEKLEPYGAKVLFTRFTAKALYDSKQADFEKRAEIINKLNPDYLLSIHQNFYEGDSRVYGPQVFYNKDQEGSKDVAIEIQRELNKEVKPSKPREAQLDNYKILRNTMKTGVLIECGFLSNPEEEKLLTTKEYQTRIAEAVVKGILAHHKG